VKNHMTNVLEKLGALDRTQAALKARELGLI
jgi:DNA-binding NarL/FixJ family response regulator